MSIVKRALRRMIRILMGKKGIYAKIGKGNRFCHDIYAHEYSIIGNYNYLGDRVVMFNAQIGNYCSIANSAKIGELTHDLSCVSTSTHIFGPSHEITKFTGKENPAIIENDVWIGSNAVIMQGVTIHTGAVIGAGAVVTNDVPAYAIVVGVPAKILRYRFDEKIIQMILDSQWWNCEEEEARKICGELQKVIDER